MTADEIKSRFPNASAAFIKSNLSAGDTGKAAKLERDIGNEPLAQEEVQGPDRERFLVRIGSRRKRLLDQDNLCEKYLVDVLRYGGVIPDDAPQCCEIKVAQTKCRKGEPEEITVEVWEVSND